MQNNYIEIKEFELFQSSGLNNKNKSRKIKNSNYSKSNEEKTDKKNSEIDERKIKNRRNRIIVFGFTEETTKSDLKEKFKRYGEIDKIIIVNQREIENKINDIKKKQEEAEKKWKRRKKKKKRRKIVLQRQN